MFCDHNIIALAESIVDHFFPSSYFPKGVKYMFFLIFSFPHYLFKLMKVGPERVVEAQNSNP